MTPQKTKITIFLFFLFGVTGTIIGAPSPERVAPVSSSETIARTIPIDEFIRLATQRDTVFETILIDELVLKYQKTLGLPAKDVVLDVKGKYDFFLDQGREEPSVEMSLSKLFPLIGTDIAVGYEATPSITSTTHSSEISVTLSQPIAENAFGHATRLLDKIIGLETDVARHQIVEAYEDYLALLLTAYYDWFEAYESLNALNLLIKRI